MADDNEEMEETVNPDHYPNVSPEMELNRMEVIRYFQQLELGGKTTTFLEKDIRSSAHN